MTVIHIILMAPQYLYNNDVTYYVNNCNNVSQHSIGSTPHNNESITSDVMCNSRTESQIKP